MTRFKMIGIEVPEFAIITEKDSIENGSIENSVQFSYNIEENIVAVHFTVIFKEENDVFLKIKIECTFIVEPSDWKVITTKKVLPKGFLRHITFQSVGALRGILFSKLEKTCYTNLILPPINVEDMIENDLSINIK